MVGERESQAASNRQRGIALLLVLFALAIASVFTLTFLSTSNTSITIAQNIGDHAKARMIAESAMSIAVRYVQENTDWRSSRGQGVWVADQPMLDGTYTLEATDEDGDFANNASDQLTMTITASVNGVSHRVSSVVTPAISNPDLKVMFVVADDAALDVVEQSHKALLESMNYQVNVLSADANEQAYQDAADNNDVAYTIRTNASTTIASRFKLIDIGLVCSDPSVIVGLKLASNASYVTSDKVEILSATHTVIDSIVAGDLTVTSGLASVGYVSGSMPTDVMKLGTTSSGGANYTIAAYEKGLLDNEGQGIIARRAFLPFYQNDASILTMDSRIVLQNAIIWAAKEVTVTGQPNALVAYYSFDESSGTVASDQGPYGMHAVVGKDKHAEFKAGKKSNGLKLHDCGSGYAYVPHNDALNLTTQGTISIWIRTEKMSRYDGLVHKGNDQGWLDEAYSLEYGDSSKISLRINSGTTVYQLVSNSAISKNVWTHVVATWSPVGMKIYIDGVLDTENTTAAVAKVSTGSMQIGNLLYDPDKDVTKVYATKGYVDELQIYNIAVDASQVTELSQLKTLTFSQTVTETDPDKDTGPTPIVLYEFAKPIPIEPELISYYPMDDDISGGGSFSFRPGLIVGQTIELWEDLKIDSKKADGGPSGHYDDKSAYVSVNSTQNLAVRMAGKAEIKGDVYVGPGGDVSQVIATWGSSKITGDREVLAQVTSLPSSVSVPNDLPASSGVLGGNNKKIDIKDDVTYDSIELTGKSEIKIKENVRVHVLGDVSLSDDTKVVLDKDHKVIFYIGGVFQLWDKSKFCEKKYPERAYVIMYGNDKELQISSEKKKYNGVFFNPNGLVHMWGELEFYGAIVAKQFKSGNKVKLHLDPRIGQEVPSSLDISTGSNVLSDIALLSNDGESHGVVGQQDGAIGKALKFDGQDNYVVIPHHASYLLDSGAISFWMKPEELTGMQGLFSKDAQGYGEGGHIQIYLDGSILKVAIGSTSQSINASSSGIQADVWQHVVVIWGIDGLKIFVNGQQKQHVPYHGGLGTSSSSTGNVETIVLGAMTHERNAGEQSPSGQYYRGYIDDLRIYNAPIDQTQISRLYAKNGAGDRVAANPVIIDTSNFQSPATLYLTDSQHAAWTNDGLRVAGPTTAQSDTYVNAVKKIAEQINASKAFSIELKVAPENLTQQVSMATYSSSSISRNFGMGQNADGYFGRVTTSSTSANGTPNIEPTSQMQVSRQHIVMTYDGTKVQLYRNGIKEVSEVRSGTLTWDDAYHLVLGGEYNSSSNVFRGIYHRLAVYDRALDNGQIRNVFAGEEPGAAGGGGTFKAKWVEPE